MSRHLIVDGRLIDDPYSNEIGSDTLPGAGAVLVSLEQWLEHRALLAGRPRLGVRLGSDQPPELVRDDLEHFTLIALEFPRFRDGRAYSYARLLRERYGFKGELRAVGDVLRDQLNFMLRAGFNAFELADAAPLEALAVAARLQSVWYQPSGDGRLTALELRTDRSSRSVS